MFGIFRSSARAPRESFHSFFVGQHDGQYLALPFDAEQVASMTYIMDNCAFAYLEQADYHRRFRKLWDSDSPRVWSAWDDASIWLVQHPRVDEQGVVATGAELGLHLLSFREEEIAYAWASSRHFPADTGLPAPLRHLLLRAAEWDSGGDTAAGEVPLSAELRAVHERNSGWIAGLHARLDARLGLDSAGPRPES